MHPIVFLATLVGAVVLIAIFVMGAKAAYSYALKVEKYYKDNKEPKEVETKSED